MSFGHWRRYFEGNQQRPLSEVAPPADVAPAHGPGRSGVVSARPRHIGIIMDGNGRWAARLRLPRAEGHRAGAEAVRRTVRAARDLEIPALTLYAFSEQNWGRPPGEVTNLMGLLATFLRDEVDELAAHGVRLVTIGDEARLPDPVRARLAEAKRRTAGGRGLLLCLALSYGSREAIVAAARTLARAAAADADPAAIDETAFAAALDSHLLPPLDLVVRTSGEQRLSNFLLWEAAYAELHFTEVLWPDFARADLEAALAAFVRRRRRFGLSDSVEPEHAVPSDTASTTPAVVEPSAPSSAMWSETWSKQLRQPASAARRERVQRRRQERAERRRRRLERARRRREAASAHSAAAIAHEVIEVQADPAPGSATPEPARDVSRPASAT